MDAAVRPVQPLVTVVAQAAAPAPLLGPLARAERLERPLGRAEAAAVPPVQPLVTVVAQAAAPAQLGPGVQRAALAVTPEQAAGPVVTRVRLEERLAQAAVPLVRVALPVVTPVAVARV